MTRNRSSAKKAGTAFETSIANCLAAHVDQVIERRARNGAKDRGDLSGWRFAGRRITAELKNVTKLSIGTWMTEAEIERGNDGGDVALVIHKRRGTADPLDQYVTTTVRDLISLTTGVRP